jgi:DNA-binding NarL/FixJ family response regulator
VRVIRVAVIDDYLIFTDAMAALLDDQPGFEVVGKGGTAASAIAIARDARPDVMLLDYHLPDRPAHEIVTTILAHSPSTRVVMLTSDTSAEARSNSLVAGAHGYVTKDQGLDRVIAAIGQVSAPV